MVKFILSDSLLCDSADSFDSFSNSESALEKDGWTDVNHNYLYDQKYGESTKYGWLLCVSLFLIVFTVSAFNADLSDPSIFLTMRDANHPLFTSFIGEILQNHHEIINQLDNSPYTPSEIIVHTLLTYRDARAVAYRLGLDEGTDGWKIFIINYVDHYFFQTFLN